MKLTAVLAPGVLTGSSTAEDVFDRAAARRGLQGRFVRTSDQAAFEAAVRTAAEDGELLLLPVSGSPVGDLLTRCAPSTTAVRVDADVAEHDASAGVRRHVRHRGLAGLGFAVESWWVHRTRPATVHRYGPDRDQWAELRLPEGPGPFPVVALLHGGFWRSNWDADTLDGIAVDLAARGFASWNVEYRRPDRCGWEATTADVAAAIDHVATVDAPLDLDRLAVVGHSAGGQLAVRLAADLPVPPRLTVSLAGCLDLGTVHSRDLSAGAAALALGGPPEDLPDRWAASDPIRRLPVGAPLAVVWGRGEDPDLLDVSRRFAAAATAAGDDVVALEGDGDHYTVIDPGSAVWGRVVELVASRVHR